VGEIKMPQLGESVVEGTITKWLKKEGDEISEDDLLVEVSTDKVDSEVPSSESGTLQKILVDEGETVKVGTPIAVVGEGASGNGQAEPSDESGEEEEAPAEAAGDKAQAEAEDEGQQEKDAAAIDSSQEEGDAAAAEAESEGDQGETQEQPEAKGDQGEAKEEEKTQEESGQEAEAPKSKDDTSKRGIISPLVRRLADENDVNLDEVEGTGTGGRIRKADVMKYVETRKSKPAAKPAASAEPAPEEAKPEKKEAAKAEPSVREISEREELVPWTNIRRRTAEHMVASSRETARAWNAVEADWSDIVQLREKAKASFKEREGFNLTYTPFLARVVCETLLDMPEVNATFDEENQGNRVKHYVNLGIAVALEGGGLIVPVVKGADEKNLVGLARDISDLANRARSKKLSPDDLVGGTFTITNPGPFGSIISVPIIPRGQAAILGFEAIKKRVTVTDDDAIAIRSMNFLSLSWDHRIIDGAEAARFLQRLAEKVETTDFSSELSHYL
jgi:2-oxoglutarate dehydrogenase E2 component (dihydrolipoamide succinyltransferase)